MRKAALINLFNLSFGLIDLYQALASFLHLPPEQYFHWTWADDILHILIGLALVIIGSYGMFKRVPGEESGRTGLHTKKSIL